MGMLDKLRQFFALLRGVEGARRALKQIGRDQRRMRRARADDNRRFDGRKVLRYLKERAVETAKRGRSSLEHFESHGRTYSIDGNGVIRRVR